MAVDEQPLAASTSISARTASPQTAGTSRTVGGRSVADNILLIASTFAVPPLDEMNDGEEPFDYLDRLERSVFFPLAVS